MIVYAVIERQNGERPAEEYGQNIGAMGLDRLDEYLRDDPATPLSDFMHEDVQTLEQALKIAQPAERPAIERALKRLQARPDWHDPQDGLTTVKALLERLPAEDQHAGVRDDLEAYQRILQATADAGDKFRINVLTSI
jgi:hypothetical protein